MAASFAFIRINSENLNIAEPRGVNHAPPWREAIFSDAVRRESPTQTGQDHLAIVMTFA
jgi:hypothetical protein